VTGLHWLPKCEPSKWTSQFPRKVHLVQFIRESSVISGQVQIVSTSSVYFEQVQFVMIIGLFTWYGAYRDAFWYIGQTRREWGATWPLCATLAHLDIDWPTNGVYNMPLSAFLPPLSLLHISFPLPSSNMPTTCPKPDCNHQITFRVSRGTSNQNNTNRGHWYVFKS